LILQTLESLESLIGHDGPPQTLRTVLNNFKNEVSSHMENTAYLLEFAHKIRKQISDTLNLRNQDISLHQSEDVFKLSKSSARDSVAIRIITFLTLIYLPFSFIAVSRELLIILKSY